jgi:hypothetical protein
MANKTLDPKLFHITVAGRALSGFADGTYIRVERRNPTYSLTVGADGEAARAKSNDKSGSVTVTLIQTSADNDFLSDLALADELTNAGVFPLTIIDDNGSTVVGAAQAWITQPAAIENAKEVQGREWVIESGSMDMFTGGND